MPFLGQMNWKKIKVRLVHLFLDKMKLKVNHLMLTQRPYCGIISSQPWLVLIQSRQLFIYRCIWGSLFMIPTFWHVNLTHLSNKIFCIWRKVKLQVLEIIWLTLDVDSVNHVLEVWDRVLLLEVWNGVLVLKVGVRAHLYINNFKKLIIK